MSGQALALCNTFGNVDVRKKLPARYVHVKGQRLTALCKKLGIKHAPALVGFQKHGRYGFSPILDGVVVTKTSSAKLLEAIETRIARSTSPAAVAKRERMKARKEAKLREFNEKCSNLGILVGSRTSKWLQREKIDADHAELIAFKTSYRHEYTAYDEEMDELRNYGYTFEERQDARIRIRETATETPIPNSWDEYLRTYQFDSDIAKALAAVLQDPKDCHPRWFKEAEIAVRRASLPLAELSYHAIKRAIDTWRSEREVDSEGRIYR